MFSFPQQLRLEGIIMYGDFVKVIKKYQRASAGPDRTPVYNPTTKTGGLI